MNLYGNYFGVNGTDAWGDSVVWGGEAKKNDYCCLEKKRTWYRNEYNYSRDKCINECTNNADVGAVVGATGLGIMAGIHASAGLGAGFLGGFSIGIAIGCRIACDMFYCDKVDNASNYETCKDGETKYVCPVPTNTSD